MPSVVMPVPVPHFLPGMPSVVMVYDARDVPEPEPEPEGGFRVARRRRRRPEQFQCPGCDWTWQGQDKGEFGTDSEYPWCAFCDLLIGPHHPDVEELVCDECGTDHFIPKDAQPWERVCYNCHLRPLAAKS